MVKTHLFRLAATVLAVVLIAALSYGPAATANTLTDVFREWMNETLIDSGYDLSQSQFRSVWSAFTATFVIGAIAGALVVTPLTNRMSRKMTIMTAGAISVFGSILSAVAKPSKSVPLLFIGRLVSAFTVPIIAGAGSLFNTELPEVKYRGLCGCATSLGLSTGGIFNNFICQPFLLGTDTNWPFVFVVSACGVAFGTSILAFFSHGSPHYLYLVAQDTKKAAKSVEFYQGAARRNDGVLELEAEMEGMRKHTDKSRTIDIFRKSLRKTTFLVFVIVTGCIFSGVAAISMFSTEIVQTAGASFSNAKLVALAVSASQVVTSIPTSFLVDRVGRRKVYMTGVTGVILCNTAVVVCTGLITLGKVESPILTWFTASALILMNALYGLQEVVVLFVANELYDQKSRNAAVGFVTLLFWLQSFVQGVSYPYMLQFLGLMYSLIPFVVIPFFALVYAFFFLPETANRTILEITGNGGGSEERDQVVERASGV